MKITIEHEVTGRRIADLMVSAIEGGVNYWCAGMYLKVPDPKTIDHDWWYDYAPLYDRDDLIIEVKVQGDKPRTVTKKDFEEGIKFMAARYPRHWADFIAENDDAETADVFVQCVVFREIVYG